MKNPEERKKIKLESYHRKKDLHTERRHRARAYLDAHPIYHKKIKIVKEIKKYRVRSIFKFKGSNLHWFQ